MPVPRASRGCSVSPALVDLGAEEVVRDYARRMQIEESFRY
jgi:hypothetical protein